MVKEKIIEQEKEEIKGFGIAGFTLGIFGLVLFLAPYIGLPLNILGLIFYGVQKKRIDTGLNTAGLILNIIGTVLNSIMLFIVVIALMFASVLA